MITEAPLVAPPRLPRFPLPTTAQLDNGLELRMVNLPGQHIISVAAVVEAPLTGEDPEGVGAICARLLDEGTTRHPGSRYAEVLENSGAIFGAAQDLNGVIAGVDVPASRLPAALDLLAEALIEPALADADTERQIALRLAEIEQQRASPGANVARAFRATVFNAESRAARPTAGQPDSVGQITPDAVRRYHAERYAPDRTTVIIGGDFGGQDPRELLNASFARWQTASPPKLAQPTAAAGHPGHLLLTRPEAVQANVQLGGFGIDRADSRWPALRVALHAVGGSFGSRLNLLLREELGYTYGVRLAPQPLRHGGSYALSGSFRTEVTADAIGRALDQLIIDDRPITAAEVTDAVNYFVGSAGLQWATADALVDTYARQVLLGQPDDYLSWQLRALSGINAEQATAAYADIVRTDQLSIVVVGSPELADQLPVPAHLSAPVIESAEG